MVDIATKSSISASFAQNGFETGIPVFSESEAAELRFRIEAIFQQFEKPTNVIRQLHLFFPWALDILKKPEIVAPVSAILGEDILVRGVMVLVKRPNTPDEVLWHSDHAYTQKGTTPQLSAWLALTPSFPENGCMKVMPGSHRVIHPHHEVHAENHQLYKNLTIIEAPDEGQAVHLQLKPGELSLHDPMILHASGANKTDVPRIGFIIRYTTPAFAPDSLQTVRILGDMPCPHLNIVDPVFEKNDEARLAKLLSYNLNFVVNGHS